MLYLNQQFVKLLIFIVLLTCSGALRARAALFSADTTTTLSTQVSDTILSYAEKMPEFPGGSDALNRYITDNLTYPKVAKRKGICGHVNIQFVVNEVGRVVSAKILNKVEPSMDAEALRIVNSFPNWKPGLQNGKPVSVYFELPIVFFQSGCKVIVVNKDEPFVDAPDTDMVGNIWEYKSPEYSGGQDSLYQFLVKNMKYPKDAEEKGIGGVVYVKMKVDKTGKIIDPKVTMGVCPSIDKEALRLVNLFPQLTPGKKKKEPVDWIYTFKLIFDTNLNNTTQEKLKTDTLLSDKVKNEPLCFVEEMPEFPGGQDAMMKYLYSHIRYPELAAKMGITGRVTLQFIVNENGYIGSVKVLHGIGGGCDEEAIRVLKLMPHWKPGKQDGKNVPVFFTFPVIFQLKQ